MMKKYKYRNGNYLVRLIENGTKIYQTLKAGEDFNPEFPDSLDIKLTNKCQYNCPFCHENSTINGKHCNLEWVKDVISILPEYPIELAFGGGNLLLMEEKELLDFFEWCKKRNHKVAITLNDIDYLLLLDGIWPTLEQRKNLIDSIGVSLRDNETSDKLMNKINLKKRNLNSIIVYHLVLGTFSKGFLKNLLMNETNGRFIFLGYKQVGRGKTWEKIPSVGYFEEIRSFLVKEVINHHCNDTFSSINVLSFDNLALSQLRIKDLLTTKEWNNLYMGNEFSHSMYIDAVEKKFGPSSLSIEKINSSDWNNDIINYFKNNKNEH